MFETIKHLVIETETYANVDARDSFLQELSDVLRSAGYNWHALPELKIGHFTDGKPITMPVDMLEGHPVVRIKDAGGRVGIAIVVRITEAFITEKTGVERVERRRSLMLRESPFVLTLHRGHRTGGGWRVGVGRGQEKFPALGGPWSADSSHEFETPTPLLLDVNGEEFTSSRSYHLGLIRELLGNGSITVLTNLARGGNVVDGKVELVSGD